MQIVWVSHAEYDFANRHITLPALLSNYICVFHASHSSLLSVFHLFVRVMCPPPGGWQGETGNRFRRGGAAKKPPMGSSGLWPCAALSGLVCMWECWTVTPSLTACRGANRSNRGTLSTCQAVPSQHTAALSLYSFTGVSISVCGNCAALHVCLCMHRYRWQIIILLAFSRTYTKEICSDFWFSAHFLFY